MIAELASDGQRMHRPTSVHYFPYDSIASVRLFGFLVLLFLSGCEARVYYGLLPESLASGTVADSRQPTLRWESFPRPVDRMGTLAQSSNRITQVTYELRIWAASELGTPGMLVFERRGLDVPYHHLEEPLEPMTKYYWTVRAGFLLDDEPRVTEWGRILTLPGGQVVFPSPFQDWDTYKWKQRRIPIPNSLCYSFYTPP